MAKFRESSVLDAPPAPPAPLPEDGKADGLDGGANVDECLALTPDTAVNCENLVSLRCCGARVTPPGVRRDR